MDERTKLDHDRVEAPYDEELRSAVAPLLIIQDLVLRHPCDNCRFGYGYTYTNQLQFYAYCAQCDERQSGYAFSHVEVLGGSEDDRENRFVIATTLRKAILKRDMHRCVHCNNEALTAAEAQTTLVAVLARELGSDWLAFRSGDHGGTCQSCHQYLPGVVLSVPAALMQKLSAKGREEIRRTLRRRRLDIDHLISVHVQRHLRKPIERDIDDFLRHRLLVTSCHYCNIGIGKTLRPEAEIEAIVRLHISEDERAFDQDRRLLKRAHFEARLAERQLSAAS